MFSKKQEDHKVTVRVPASSANMGPGFDCLAVALQLYLRVTMAEEDGDALHILGTRAEFAGRSNLAYLAYEKAMERMGLAPRGLRMYIDSRIPISRGLGSSAALCLAGAACASALHGHALSRHDILEIATALEGHPDNLAPALLGGLTAAMMDDDGPAAIQLPISERLRFCAFVPGYETCTRDMRAVLPAFVPYADAVYNIGHASLLIPALAAGDDKAIARALHDRMHEPYRTPLLYGFDEVKQAALSEGCIAFYVSGSGSTLMSIYADPEFPKAMAKRIARVRGAWRVMPLAVDRAGTVEEEGCVTIT